MEQTEKMKHKDKDEAETRKAIEHGKKNPWKAAEAEILEPPN